MHTNLRDFLVVLAGSASVLGIVYIGMTLIFGAAWITENATQIFSHGLYWLLIPPSVWYFRYKPTEEIGFRSPTVKVILDSGTLVTEPCAWMGIRTAVSVYKVVDEVELLVFPAYVVNVQSNKMVQLVPLVDDSSAIDAEQLRPIKETLLIKPGQLHE